MIKVQEKGRRLHIEVGDGDEAVRLVIDPVDVQTGQELLVDFLSVVATDPGDDPDAAAVLAQAASERATSMMKVALGEGNYRQVMKLRAAEARDVSYAALLWNTEGGGIGVTNTYLEDGLPKAMSAVFEAAGLLPKRPSTT